MGALDRLEALIASPQVTGLDFIYVHQNQTTLDVFFLKHPSQTAPAIGDFGDKTKLRIYSLTGGETLAEVPVQDLEWIEVDADGGLVDPPQHVNALRLTTAMPGDFSRYALHVDDPRIDPFFNDIEFSFKANCKSYLDCKARSRAAEAGAWVDFPVDYQARDFWSFRRALLDFASQRYPDWQDRLEADAGMMLTETMSALADEMAYYQDRVGREAHLETASQRRSLRGHARLVDYNLHDGLGGKGWLDVTVEAGAEGLIPAGSEVTDQSGSLVYEIGRGLAETLALKTYPVSAVRNSFAPHQWDESATLILAGSTHLYIEGQHSADLPWDDLPAGQLPGKWVLLLEQPANAAQPIRAWMVRVIKATDETDPVFNQGITRLEWEASQALPFDLDVALLTIRGNMVPITAGRTHVESFTIGEAADAQAGWTQALEREGANAAASYRFSLPGSDEADLVWLGTAPRSAEPEIDLREKQWDGTQWVCPQAWEWRRTLVGVNSSQASDPHFVLEDGFWKRVAGFRRAGVPEEIVHQDYAQDQGWTVRFGNGEFGCLPAVGTVFEATYRLGKGTLDNALAGTLCRLNAVLSFNAEVTNPMDIANGSNQETAGEIKQLAPEEFRAVTYRAVRPEDYAEAAERLDWVQRAGGAFRYTGSWLSAFVTPDPEGTYFVAPERRRELEQQLDRFRQAGREAYAADPRFATLDFEISVCVEPTAYAGEVKERVLAALLGGASGAQPGFFAPDNFTFGTPLHRSRLEQAIQDVPGVRTVHGIRFRRRGWFEMRDFSELVYRVAGNEVIRVDHNPDFPERGSVRLIMRGGA